MQVTPAVKPITYVVEEVAALVLRCWYFVIALYQVDNQEE
jgi:hypothetical protein